MLPHRSDRKGNPYLGILRSELERQGVRVGPVPWVGQGGLTALHVHWLEAPMWGRLASRLPLVAELRVARVLHLARRLRAQGKAVVWTAHNLAPHDIASPRHERNYRHFRQGFLPLVSDIICMSETVRESVRQAFPELSGARFHVVRHPHYVAHFASFPSEVPIELKGRVPAKGAVIATFGQLRPYKNIPGTIRLLRDAARDFHFIIAGKGPEPEMDRIRAAIGEDPRFTFIARRLSDPEIAGLTGASDLILMNFKTTLNSGSVLASLSLGRPVLAPDFGAISDLKADVGAGWVRTFHGELALSDVEAALDSPPIAGTPDLRAFDPVEIAQQHCSIYARQGVAIP